MPVFRLSTALLCLPLILAAPASARPGGWGYDPWRPMAGDWRSDRVSSGRDEREGKVDSDRFMTQDAAPLLGHGSISVAAAPGTSTSEEELAWYEAATVDQLARAGYDTVKPDPAEAQQVQLKLVRDVAVPEEEKRKPVSGEVTVGASNRGSMFGMALAVDLTKPRKALLHTRLDARIVEPGTGRTLWEGHAGIYTREGDSRWTDQAIATRLAAALFDRFPQHGSATLVSN